MSLWRSAVYSPAEELGTTTPATGTVARAPTAGASGLSDQLNNAAEGPPTSSSGHVKEKRELVRSTSGADSSCTAAGEASSSSGQQKITAGILKEPVAAKGKATTCFGNDEFECRVCYGLVTGCLECGECGNIFCRDCAEKLVVGASSREEDAEATVLQTDESDVDNEGYIRTRQRAAWHFPLWRQLVGSPSAALPNFAELRRTTSYHGNAQELRRTTRRRTPPGRGALEREQNEDRMLDSLLRLTDVEQLPPGSQRLLGPNRWGNPARRGSELLASDEETLASEHLEWGEETTIFGMPARVLRPSRREGLRPPIAPVERPAYANSGPSSERAGGPKPRLQVERCPMCRAFYPEFRENKAIQRLADKVQTMCPQCGEMVSRERMQTHQRESCPGTEVGCPFAFVGCEWKGSRADLAGHLSLCDAYEKSLASSGAAKKAQEQNNKEQRCRFLVDPELESMTMAAGAVEAGGGGGGSSSSSSSSSKRPPSSSSRAGSGGSRISTAGTTVTAPLISTTVRNHGFGGGLVFATPRTCSAYDDNHKRSIDFIMERVWCTREQARGALIAAENDTTKAIQSLIHSVPVGYQHEHQIL